MGLLGSFGRLPPWRPDPPAGAILMYRPPWDEPTDNPPLLAHVRRVKSDLLWRELVQGRRFEDVEPPPMPAPVKVAFY